MEFIFQAKQGDGEVVHWLSEIAWSRYSACKYPVTLFLLDLIFHLGGWERVLSYWIFGCSALNSVRFFVFVFRNRNIIEEKFGILCRTVGWAFEILYFFFWVFGLKMIVIKLVWRNQLHLILQISLFSLLLPILLLFDSLFCHSVFAFPFLIFKAWNGCFGAIWRRLLWGSQAEVANLQLKTGSFNLIICDAFLQFPPPFVLLSIMLFLLAHVSVSSLGLGNFSGQFGSGFSI